MIGALLTDLIGAIRFWVVLLIMAPVAYLLGKYIYKTGDGWIKILGQEDFAKKAIAVIAVAVGLPLATVFAGRIRSFLLAQMPTGMWLLPFIGIGLFGVLWMVNDAANMNLLDGQRSTHLILSASFLFIVTPFAIQHITSTYDLGLLWQTTIVQPIMNGVVAPIRSNIHVIVLGLVLTGYVYYRYQTG